MTPRLRVLRVLVLSQVVAACSGREGAGPEPGTELYAVAPGAVTEVLFSSPERKMLAFRWLPDSTFQLVFAARGRPDTERCTAGEGFHRWLIAVSSMPIGRRVERPFDRADRAWTDVRLRDTTQIDPIDVRLRIPSASDEPVVIQFGEQQYSVNMDAAVLRTVDSACQAVGAGAARPRR